MASFTSDFTSLACEDDIIEDVTDQIIKGWTEEGSHGYKHSGDADPSTALDKAVRAVALGAGEVAVREIRQLADTYVVNTHITTEQTNGLGPCGT